MASLPNTYPREEETFPTSLYGKPDRRSYRAAIKQVVLDVKARQGLSSEQLAEKLGVSKDTVENAEEEASSLEAVTLLKIAFLYGEDAIDPVRALYLCAPARDETTTEKRKRLIRELAALEDA